MSSQTLTLPIVQLTEHSSVPLERVRTSVQIESQDYLKAIFEPLSLGNFVKRSFPFGAQELPSFEVVNSEIKTNYHVGVDWLIPEKIAIKVIPKVNDSTQVVDVVGVLREVLEDSDNQEHLEGLIHIDFYSKPIPLTSDDGLSLFVITAFIASIRQILKRGLKKSFYDRQEVLRFKVKGKVILTETLSKTKVKPIIQNLTCKYQDFGVDIPENQLLKAALKASLRQVRNQIDSFGVRELEKSVSSALSFFCNVSDVSRRALDKNFQINPFFKTYKSAIRLARMILKLERYSDSNTRVGEYQKVPAYWIDMPKLFELYVYKKLKEAVGTDGVVVYHEKFHWQELDYLAKSQFNELPYFIADAKYKPKYSSIDVIKEDARQLAGYARLSKVVQTLKKWGMVNENLVLPCLVIYPEQTASSSLNLTNVQPIDSYVKFFKIGIKLPTIDSSL